MVSPLNLSHTLLGLKRDGTAEAVGWESGPPPRIDGFVIGAPFVEADAPPRHGGEMHPDADEVLVLISGRVDVHLEEDGLENVVEVTAGQAIVVPRGIWHRVVVREFGQLLHITPGPGGEWRPVKDGGAA
jgi:mannose-6-phosphate isomerase-like protein (cupin superfamily)